MLHHLSIGVRDLARSARFYDAALGALGFRRVFEDDEAIGYGLEEDKDLLCLKLRPDASAPGPGFHIAFTAPSRAAVAACHAAALPALDLLARIRAPRLRTLRSWLVAERALACCRTSLAK